MQLVIQILFIILAYSWPLLAAFLLGVVLEIDIERASKPDWLSLKESMEWAAFWRKDPEQQSPPPVIAKRYYGRLVILTSVIALLIYIFLLPYLYSWNDLCFLCGK